MFVRKVHLDAVPFVRVAVLRHDRVGHDLERDGTSELVRGGGLAQGEGGHWEEFGRVLLFLSAITGSGY